MNLSNLDEFWAFCYWELKCPSVCYCVGICTTCPLPYIKRANEHQSSTRFHLGLSFWIRILNSYEGRLVTEILTLLYVTYCLYHGEFSEELFAFTTIVTFYHLSTPKINFMMLSIYRVFTTNLLNKLSPPVFLDRSDWEKRNDRKQLQVS